MAARALSLLGSPSPCRLVSRHQAARELLSQHLREQLWSQAIGIVEGELRSTPRLRAELESLYHVTLHTEVEGGQLGAARGFAEGAVTVLDRDFVQLLNGPHAVLFEDCSSIEFLMGETGKHLVPPCAPPPLLARTAAALPPVATV